MKFPTLQKMVLKAATTVLIGDAESISESDRLRILFLKENVFTIKEVCTISKKTQSLSMVTEVMKMNGSCCRSD